MGLWNAITKPFSVTSKVGKKVMSTKAGQIGTTVALGVATGGGSVAAQTAAAVGSMAAAKASKNLGGEKVASAVEAYQTIKGLKLAKASSKLKDAASKVKNIGKMTRNIGNVKDAAATFSATKELADDVSAATGKAQQIAELIPGTSTEGVDTTGDGIPDTPVDDVSSTTEEEDVSTAAPSSSYRGGRRRRRRRRGGRRRRRRRRASRRISPAYAKYHGITESSSSGGGKMDKVKAWFNEWWWLLMIIGVALVGVFIVLAEDGGFQLFTPRKDTKKNDMKYLGQVMNIA